MTSLWCHVDRRGYSVNVAGWEICGYWWPLESVQLWNGWTLVLGRRR